VFLSVFLLGRVVTESGQGRNLPDKRYLLPNKTSTCYEPVTSLIEAKVQFVHYKFETIFVLPFL